MIYGSIPVHFEWDLFSNYLGGSKTLIVHFILIAGVLATVFVVIFIAFFFLQNDKIKNRVEIQTRELRASEKQFRALLNSAPDATIIVDTNGNIMLTNHQVTRLFGYEAEELLGEKIEILVPDKFHNIHLSHRDSYVMDPAIIDMSHLRDLSAKRKDGSIFPAEISLSPIKTEEGLLISSSVRDITDRKRAEENLRASEQRLAMALTAANMVAWERDLITGITNADAFYENILGFESGELNQTADSWKKIVHPDDATHVPKTLDLFLDGKIPEFRVQYRAYTKDRKLKWIEAVGDIAERDEEGNPVKLTGTQQDITNQKEAEVVLQGKLEELEEFNQLAVGRELKMIELKKEINELLNNMGMDAEYEIVE